MNLLKRLKSWWHFHSAMSKALQNAPNRAEVIKARETATVDANMNSMIASMKERKAELDEALERSEKVLQEANNALSKTDSKKSDSS